MACFPSSMKTLLALLFLALPAAAQSVGDYLVYKWDGSRWQKQIITPGANSFLAWNVSGAPIPMSFTSVATVGTITTGTWQGTPIASTYIASANAWDAKQPGDTGLTALAAGSDFVQFTGPTGTTKVFTLPNASSTLLTSGGALGTPSSATLTNATGLPISGMTGLGSGVAAALATASVGSGGIVLGNQAISTGSSPTFSALTITNGAGFGNNITTAGSMIATQAVRADSYVTIQKTGSAPAAAANFVRIYADGGGVGGKMRLMALFPTGAAQPVALEP